jgi:hypothetical protein
LGHQELNTLKRLSEYLVLLFLYGFVFCLISGFNTWEAFTTSIIGQGPDPYQYIWNAHNFQKQFANGGDVFYTPLLMHPEGTSLVMHTYTPVIGMLNVLIKNPYLSCNVALILSFMFSGLGAYLLGFHLIKKRSWAIISGFIFAFSPFKTTHLLEHYHLLLTATVPFTLLLLFKAFPDHKLHISRNNIWSVFGIACLLALSFFSDYYTTFAILVFITVYFTYGLVNSWKWKHWLLIIAVVWIASHLIIEPIHIQQTMDNKGAFYNTSDVLAFITPPENSLIYGWWNGQNWREKLAFKGVNEQVAFLGFGLLLMFFLGLWRSKKSQTKFLSLLLILLFFLVFPKIKIAGASVSYSPTAFLHYIPFLNNIRNPSRMIMLFYLILPLWIGLRIESAEIKTSIKRVLPILLLLSTIIEYVPKAYPKMKKTDVEHVFERLAEEENDLGLWNIPTGLVDGFQKVGDFDVKHLQRQMVHGKPLVGGYISRIDSTVFNRFKLNPYIAYYNLGIGLETINSFASDTEVKSFIQGMDLGYIVLDTTKISAQGAEHLEQQFESFITEKLVESNFILYKLDQAFRN